MVETSQKKCYFCEQETDEELGKVVNVDGEFNAFVCDECLDKSVEEQLKDRYQEDEAEVLREMS